MVSLFGLCFWLCVALVGWIINKYEKISKRRRWEQSINSDIDELASVMAERDSIVRLRLGNKIPTRHNVIYEFDKAIYHFNRMFDTYKSQHEPGTAFVQPTLDTNVSGFISHKNVMFPYDLNDEYEKKARENFCSLAKANYKTGDGHMIHGRVITKHLSPISYAIGLARYDVMQAGFLPSNVDKKIPHGYSPYEPAPFESKLPGDIASAISLVLTSPQLFKIDVEREKIVKLQQEFNKRECITEQKVVYK